jgi:hypothetical protein
VKTLGILGLLAAVALVATIASEKVDPGTKTRTVTRFNYWIPRESEDGPGRCGVERWPVKTLSDPAASAVVLRSVPRTVADLGRLPVPTALQVRDDRDVPRQDVEKRVYRIRVRLLAFKQEADSDIHLAVADLHDPNASMIVEFPAPWCEQRAGAAPALAARTTAARTAFLKACGQPKIIGGRSYYKQVFGTASITGVAFFDRIHGQLGVAPNGIELHPAIRFRGTCS